MAKVTSFSKITLNIKGKIFSLEKPIVMGILNVTPDSFFDGGKYISENDLLKQADKMLSEGASVLDVGGYSTKPGAENINEEEEIKRVISAIQILKKYFQDCIISVDTFRASVAEKAVEAGADIINDVSGGEFDKEIFSVAGKHKVPYILTHMQGTPQTMQENPTYKNATLEIFNYFRERIDLLKSKGVHDIILDPGFGFGKQTEHNYELLKNINVFAKLGFPLLAGISRKSMINKILNTKPENALNGTTVLNTIALLNGVQILRVHDVKEAMEAIKLVSCYKEI